MAEGDLTIYQAIAEIINELEGIGKTGRNEEQHYNFRGIDAVLQHLHPLLAKYGVFFAPTVQERIYEERISSKGTVGHACHLKVCFMVYGPTGDWINVTTWGEAVDYSDKATNKAMTAAFKYALFQLFAICDPAEDGDREGPEGGTPQDVEEMTPMDDLFNLLGVCGFTLAVQHDIIEAAVGGRTIHTLADLKEGEIPSVITAVEAAMVDRDQLQEENS
jgi:hypothetical protein